MLTCHLQVGVYLDGGGAGEGFNSHLMSRELGSKQGGACLPLQDTLPADLESGAGLDCQHTACTTELLVRASTGQMQRN